VLRDLCYEQDEITHGNTRYHKSRYHKSNTKIQKPLVISSNTELQYNHGEHSGDYLGAFKK
jgi:hypothetical protein